MKGKKRKSKPVAHTEVGNISSAFTDFYGGEQFPENKLPKNLRELGLLVQTVTHRVTKQVEAYMKEKLENQWKENKKNILHQDCRAALAAVTSLTENQAIITKELAFAMQHMNRALGL